MKVRWGILGTGRIAGIFCNTLAQMEDAEIYAIGSRTKEKAEDFAKDYDVHTTYGSYEELVADEQVDIVYIATPINCHYEHIKLCLLAGKGVLCEKAFTQLSAQAEELYALAKEKGLLLMEALWTRYQPVYRKIVEWKEAGFLGEIRHVDASFYTGGKTDHRLYKDPSQGGCLPDLTIYPILYACSMLGFQPQAIDAWAMKNEHGMDVSESVRLLYENGSFASLTGGLDKERRVLLNIYGTKGRLCIAKENFFKATEAQLLDWDDNEIAFYSEPFAISGYTYEAQEAMKCFRQKQVSSNLHPMEDTIAILKILEECQRQWA